MNIQEKKKSRKGKKYLRVEILERPKDFEGRNESAVCSDYVNDTAKSILGLCQT